MIKDLNMKIKSLKGSMKSQRLGNSFNIWGQGITSLKGCEKQN